LQVIAGVNQISGRPQGRRRTHLIQDVAHTVGVRQRIFASAQRLPVQQGLGERACALALQFAFVVGERIAPECIGRLSANRHDAQRACPCRLSACLHEPSRNSRTERT
jgi:hypothetical protein